MSTVLTSAPSAVGQSLFVAGGSTTQNNSLGAKVYSNDGRAFKYVLAAGAIGAGQIVQSPAFIANHMNLTPTAVTTVGATSITVTLGATAATLNQYAGGLLITTTGTGANYSYRIASHPAASASATLVITLDDSIIVATDLTTRVDLSANPCGGVIVKPTTTTGAVIGVSVNALATGTYGWVLVNGQGNIINDAAGAITAGATLVASNTVAGSVEGYVSGQEIIGVALSTIPVSSSGSVFVRLS